jgi:ubiquinone/menaquinone biosynthesis C-methylase UbiE
MIPENFLAGWKDVDSQPAANAYVDYLHRSRNPSREYVLQHLEEYYRDLDIQPDQRILDVGCGTGFDIEMLCIFTKNLQPEVKIYGCDSSQVMFAACQKMLNEQNLHAKIFTQNVYHLSYFLRKVSDKSDGFFDRILCRCLLQHIVDPAKAITELSRVLKQSGKLVIHESDWSSLEIVTIAENASFRDKLIEDLKKQIPGYWIVQTLPHMLESAKLKVLKHIQQNTSLAPLTNYTLNIHTFVCEKI